MSERYRMKENVIWGRRILPLLITFHLSLFTAAAQDEPEYKMEAGAGIGLVAYTGDFNGNLLKGMQPWGTLIGKYHLSPRSAIGFNLGMGKIKGEGIFRYEYNFWAYGTGQEYRGARRLAPFVTIGLGLVHHSGENSGITMSLPIGAGVKYKIGQRLNLIAEWVFRLTPCDELDGRKDLYGIKSSGLFKNTDCYSVLQLALTYDIWMKCKTCHNDRD